MFEVRISPPASKYLEKLRDKNLKGLFKKAIDEISENPYMGQLKKGDLIWQERERTFTSS